jgi:hypothetical protein
MTKATRLIQAMQVDTSWKLSGPSLIGQQDGFWFLVSQSGAIQPIVVKAAFSGPDSVKLEPVKQAIKANKKVYKLAHVANEHHVLIVTLSADTNVEKNKARVTKLIFDLTRLFVQYEISSGCSLCSSSEPLQTVRIGEAPAAICTSCFEKVRSEFVAIVDRNEREGNYATGIVGALLGAIVGAGLWLLVSYLGFYASIVGFVMAFLAQFGYRLFKGKVGRLMPAVILISLIIGIFVANSVEIAIGLAQDPSLGLTFGEALGIAPLAFIDNEMFYVGKVWANAGLGLLFALMGSWRTIRNLASEAKGETYQVESI